jgi:hypothetical protein
MIGAGGIYTELLKDTAIILFPFERPDIERALGKLRLSALLDGYRNQPPVDKTRLIDAIMKIQDFVTSHKATLLEMDINPLIVCDQGEVYTADALIRCKHS